MDRETFDRLLLEQLPAAQRVAIRLTGEVNEAEEVLHDELRVLRLAERRDRSIPMTLAAPGGPAPAAGSGGAGGECRGEIRSGPKLVDSAALAALSDEVVRYRAELSCTSGQTVSTASGRSRTVVYDQEPVVAQSSAA